MDGCVGQHYSNTYIHVRVPTIHIALALLKCVYCFNLPMWPYISGVRVVISIVSAHSRDYESSSLIVHTHSTSLLYWLTHVLCFYDKHCCSDLRHCEVILSCTVCVFTAPGEEEGESGVEASEEEEEESELVAEVTWAWLCLFVCLIVGDHMMYCVSGWSPSICLHDDRPRPGEKRKYCKKSSFIGG